MSYSASSNHVFWGQSLFFLTGDFIWMPFLAFSHLLSFLNCRFFVINYMYYIILLLIILPRRADIRQSFSEYSCDSLGSLKHRFNFQNCEYQPDFHLFPYVFIFNQSIIELLFALFRKHISVADNFISSPFTIGQISEQFCTILLILK